jgi:hypothetical protein
MDHAASPANPSLDVRPPARASDGDRGPVDSVEALWDDLRRLAHELQLASPGTRRAGESLGPVVLYGAVAGALVIVAWLGVAVAVTMSLIGS